MTELYTMQRYLQYDRLQELGMAHFDCWASRFRGDSDRFGACPGRDRLPGRTRFSKFSICRS